LIQEQPAMLKIQQLAKLTSADCTRFKRNKHSCINESSSEHA